MDQSSGTIPSSRSLATKGSSEFVLGELLVVVLKDTIRCTKRYLVEGIVLELFSGSFS